MPRPPRLLRLSVTGAGPRTLATRRMFTVHHDRSPPRTAERMGGGAYAQPTLLLGRACAQRILLTLRPPLHSPRATLPHALHSSFPRAHYHAPIHSFSAGDRRCVTVVRCTRIPNVRLSRRRMASSDPTPRTDHPHHPASMLAARAQLSHALTVQRTACSVKLEHAPIRSFNSQEGPARAARTAFTHPSMHHHPPPSANESAGTQRPRYLLHARVDCRKRPTDVVRGLPEGMQ